MDVFESLLVSNDAVGIKKLLAKDRKKQLIRHRFPNGQNALHRICENGDVLSLKVLLKGNASPNTVDDTLSSPLHIACKLAHIDIVTLLIHENANVSEKCIEGQTPLHLLVRHKPNNTNLPSFYRTLEAIKSAGANLNERNNQGETPLHMACLKSSKKNAMWLIRNGVDVNISNKHGDTPLHYAIQYGSANLVFILLRAGASITREGLRGTPLDIAIHSKRQSIIQLIEEVSKNSDVTAVRTLVLNGRELTMERLLDLKSICLQTFDRLRVEKLKRTRTKKSNKSLQVGPKYTEVHVMVSVITLNSLLLVNRRNSWPANFWSGMARFSKSKEADIDKWDNYYCCIEDWNLALYPNKEAAELQFQRTTISLQSNISLQVYFTHPRRFSIMQQTQSGDKFEYIEVGKEGDLIPFLKTLVSVSGKPVEYIEGSPLIDLVEELEQSQLIQKGQENREAFQSPMSPRKSRLRIFSNLSAKNVSFSGDLQSSNSSLSPRRITTNLPVKGNINVTAAGEIISEDFRHQSFSDIFTSSLDMKVYEGDNPGYIMTAGSLSDILNYLILHCGSGLFVGNRDIGAFYMNFYRYGGAKQVISEIEKLWPKHCDKSWPSLYSTDADSRLLYFIEGFIKSPFVLQDFNEEIQFRSSLIDLYGSLVPAQSSIDLMNQLRVSLSEIKKAREQATVGQMCDLNSLLNASKNEECGLLFDLHKYTADVIAEQIVAISADLYRQLQISEIIDLRYQKDKKLAVAVNKLHAFSNKTYLFVPTTILQSDEPAKQAETLKKWIVICEKVFQLKDYNSTLQIINGVSETSVIRLKHLKESLSAKWVERFEKLRSLFDPANGFQNYRKLPIKPPCIPFIGIALKDLTFTYEGNQDFHGNAINFDKIRLTAEILRSLMIDKPEQIDYSFLKFEPEIAQALLAVTPLSQDELFDRSLQIENSLNASSIDVESKLRKEILLLQSEITRLKELNEEKDQIIQQKDRIINALTSDNSNTPIIMNGQQMAPINRQRSSPVLTFSDLWTSPRN